MTNSTIATRTSVLLRLLVVFAGLSFVWLTSACDPSPFGRRLISKNAQSEPANAGSFSAASSADGNYVVFTSSASNLVPGDTNGATDVFVFQRSAPSVLLRISAESLSLTPGGVFAQDISSDGRYVSIDHSSGLYVFDRTAQVLDLVAPSGFNAKLSNDARYVAFASGSSTIVPGDTNGFPDVFVHDRQTSLTTRLSLRPDGSQYDSFAGGELDISGNGAWVTYTVGGTGGTITCGYPIEPCEVVVQAQAIPTIQHVFEGVSPAISDTGDLIAYQKIASSSPFRQGVFVFDLSQSSHVEVGLDAEGNASSSFVGRPSISGNGRFVGFTSSQELTSHETFFGAAYVRDLQMGITYLAATSANGDAPNQGAQPVSMPSDGEFVVVESTSSNLAPGLSLGRSYVHGYGEEVWDEGVPGCVFQAGQTCMFSSGPAVLYVDVDPLGSPVAATDETGAIVWRETYTPFGDRIADAPDVTSTNSQWFTGADQEPITSLVSLGSRFYNPEIGRFYGMDPVAIRDTDPHSFNRYAYANNNPYRYVDPSGEIPLDTLWDVANVGIGIGSFVKNVAAGNFVGAAIDAAGVVADTAAAIVPYVPGGAGTAIRSARAGEAVVSAVRASDNLVDAGRAVETGTTTVYRSLDAAGDVNYVGITNNLQRRASTHLRQKGIQVDKIRGLGNLSRADARAVEQTLIELHGLGKNGGTLLNKINSIAAKNPAHAAAVKRGRELLRDAGYGGL